MLGQRASSQTVWRLSWRRPVLSWLRDWKWVRLLRAQSGRRGRGFPESWTRGSVTLEPDRVHAGVLQIGLGAAQRGRICVGSDQHARQVVGAGGQHDGETFVLE